MGTAVADMLEQLQRQVYEIEALDAVFSDGDLDSGGGSSGVNLGSALFLSPSELQTLKLAQQICEAAGAGGASGHVRDSGAEDDEWTRDDLLLGLPMLSGTIRPPGLQFGDQPVALRFTLPRGYPGAAQTSSGGCGGSGSQGGASCQGGRGGQGGAGGGVGGRGGRGEGCGDDAGGLRGRPTGATALGNSQSLPTGQLHPGSHRRASLSVECNAHRLVHERLSTAVAAVADREAEVGCECLLLAVEVLKDAVERELQGGMVDVKPHGRTEEAEEGSCGEADGEGEVAIPAAATAAAIVLESSAHCDGIGRGRGRGRGVDSTVAAPCPSTPAGNEAEAGLLCVLVWLHHLKSATKRKLIVQWARELQLGGACKPGYPGVVVVEGHSDDVREFLQRMRSLSWQAMQVRGQDMLPLTTTTISGNNDNGTTSKAIHTNNSTVSSSSSSGDSRLATAAQRVAALRRLPNPHDVPFVELGEEGGMSALAAMCRAGGLHHVFMTALKL